MNADVKKKWVDALRSGNYEQDSSSSLLRTSDGYCCLGVLCDIAEKEGVVKGRPDSVVWFAYGAEAAAAYLPKEVVAWAGLDGKNPSIGPRRDDNLALLNDRGTPFREIADLIEEQL